MALIVYDAPTTPIWQTRAWEIYEQQMLERHGVVVEYGVATPDIFHEHTRIANGTFSR